MARILVVDDEEAVCEGLKTFLTAKDHEVEIALSGEKGMEKLKTFHPHLVLLDIRMPGLSGLEVLPRMKKLDTSVRIVMVSAVEELEAADAAVHKGADDHIMKPVNLHLLRSIINDLVE